jgi:release factor glutamine methyltransferase
MTVKEMLTTCKEALASIYQPAEAVNITKLLLEHTLTTPVAQLIQQSNNAVTPVQEKKIREQLLLLLQHHPIQYVLEEAWFYKFPFYVNKDVLIPRPETEELVLLTLQSLKQSKIVQPKILEIGTGSGCIAISLKKEFPAANITAIDCSAAALQVATQNAKTLGADIQLLELDFLNTASWEQLGGAFDFIVSNPPYIAMQEKATMQPNVLEHEPHLALFVEDSDPLIFYKKIALYGKQWSDTPIILCEINEALGMETKEVFLQQDYHFVTVLQDMQGKDRMVKVVGK